MKPIRSLSLFVLLLLAPLVLADSGAEPILQYSDRFHPVPGYGGMVVSQEELASEAGAAILAQGGNAVDAAVATGFSLAVTLPQAGNLGGGGFMMIHLAESDTTIALPGDGSGGRPSQSVSGRGGEGGS